MRNRFIFPVESLPSTVIYTKRRILRVNQVFSIIPFSFKNDYKKETKGKQKKPNSITWDIQNYVQRQKVTVSKILL